MARTLAKTVHVEDETHGRAVYLAGTVPPDWAQNLIQNPKAWQSDEDTNAEGESEGSSDEHGGEVKRPGKSGPGSGRDQWAAYATSVGVEVGDQMSRDDIMAAVDALED